MNIKTKYGIGDTVFIINFAKDAVFKATIDTIDVSVDEEGKEITYDLLIEIPVGVSNEEYIIDGDFCEECIFPSKREALAKLKEVKEQSEKAKADEEERRAKYEELKKEFDPVKSPFEAVFRI